MEAWHGVDAGNRLAESADHLSTAGTADICPYRHRGRSVAAAALVGLGASMVALATAPLLMPAPYSWIANTTSESAAQGVDGGWLARLGFLFFGLSVIALAFITGDRWGSLGSVLHFAFGAFMTAGAAFSTRPVPGGVFDRVEDALHSAAATTMGFAFAAGVVVAAAGRRRQVRPAGSPAPRCRRGVGVMRCSAPRCWR